MESSYTKKRQREEEERDGTVVEVIMAWVTLVKNTRCLSLTTPPPQHTHTHTHTPHTPSHPHTLYITLPYCQLAKHDCPPLWHSVLPSLICCIYPVASVTHTHTHPLQPYGNVCVCVCVYGLNFKSWCLYYLWGLETSSGIQNKSIYTQAHAHKHTHTHKWHHWSGRLPPLVLEDII